MKTFVIPSLFVIQAYSEKEAEELAGEMQSNANDEIYRRKGIACLLLDEEKPTVEIVHVNGDDYPHTYNPYPTCRKCGSKLDYRDSVNEFLHSRCTDETCPYSNHEQDWELD